MDPLGSLGGGSGREYGDTGTKHSGEDVYKRPALKPKPKTHQPTHGDQADLVINGLRP